MLPTPSTSHVNYNHVYEPAEDSYLLLDTLSSATEIAFLKARFPARSTSPLVLEVGTGSGVVLAFVTAHADVIFGRADVATMGVDVNPFACVAAKETIRKAAQEQHGSKATIALFLDAMIGDLTSVIKPSSVDVLLFNPPYVPSKTLPSILDGTQGEGPKDAFARDLHLLSLSTDGGSDGMEITDRLLCQLPEVLSERGTAYILLCASNKPEEVMSRIRAWQSPDECSWNATIVGSSGKKAGWEKLCVIRIWRSNAQPDADD